MSVNTPTTNIYSNGPIKGLEYIQNKALVVAPFEITKAGKLDPDLLLDTPGIININLYKKMVSGEDKEPTTEQFKTIKYISEIDSSNQISSFDIPVIFKYDKETGIRTIEKDLTQVSNNLDYIDFTIDVSNTDLSSETGSNGFYCVCQVQKISKPASTTAFTEVANDEFLFMIPSVECREIPELVEFDLLDTDNKVINIKKVGAPGIPDILFEGNLKLTQNKDFFNDGSNVATYLFNDNLEEENTNYTPESNGIGYNDGQFGKAVTFYGRNTWVTGQLPNNTVGVSLWFKLSATTNGVLPTLFSANKNNEIFRIFPDPARGQIHIRNASTGNKTLVRVTKNIETNRWYHIYMDNSMNGLYVDGVYYPVTGSSSFDYNYISPINTFELNNRYNPSNGNYISGYVEQFRIFSQALLSDEILDLSLNSPKSLIFNSDRDITEIAIDASIKLDDLDNLTIFDLDNETNYTPITSEEILYSDPDFFNDGSNVASYFFNDNLNDASGKFNGVASTSINANFSYEIGKFGKSIKTNSSTSSVNLGIPQGTSTLLVVSFWLKWNGVNAVTPINLGTDATGVGQCLYFVNSLVGINSHNSDITGFPSSGLNGIWKHLTVEFNTGKVGRIWIDGIEQKLISTSGTFNSSKAVTSNIPITIGFDGFGNFGEIDQVRVFNRSLLRDEIYSLFKETKQLKYMVNLNTPTKNLKITTGLSATYIKAKVLTFPDLTKQGYRIHPVIKIPETPTTPKFYLGSKYQRNLMEVLAPALKSKRTIYNLKDMYLVDDICLATLQKINQQLELDSMIKLTERLYNAKIVEKINAEYLLEFITSSVANSNNYNCNQIIVDSLIGDYLFTQEEIDNLNSNLNTFKNRARLTIPVVTIAGDQFKFNLPTSFVDSNRSGSLKTNLVIFGTDNGFDKYSLISGTIPMYSDITKLETPRVLNDLIGTLPTLASLKNGNIESYLTMNTPIIFARTTSTGVTDISSNVQKAPGLISDVDANGIRGMYSAVNAASYSSANNFNFGTGDFTIEFDLKSTISQDNTFFVIGKQDSACHLLVYLSNNCLVVRAGLNIWGWESSSDRSTPARSILPGVYYHVVLQRTNGVLDIYIDGVKIHTSAWAYNIGATGNIWFGSYFGGSGHTNYRFNNFEVYKRAKYTGNFNSKTRYSSSDKFKSILTDYKQRLPFTYIPLSTNMDDVGSKPVFENLTNITGFNHSEIVIDIPNVL